MKLYIRNQRRKPKLHFQTLFLIWFWISIKRAFQRYIPWPYSEKQNFFHPLWCHTVHVTSQEDWQWEDFHFGKKWKAHTLWTSKKTKISDGYFQFLKSFPLHRGRCACVYAYQFMYACTCFSVQACVSVCICASFFWVDEQHYFVLLEASWWGVRRYHNRESYNSLVWRIHMHILQCIVVMG